MQIRSRKGTKTRPHACGIRKTRGKQTEGEHRHRRHERTKPKQTDKHERAMPRVEPRPMGYESHVNGDIGIGIGVGVTARCMGRYTSDRLSTVFLPDSERGQCDVGSLQIYNHKLIIRHYQSLFLTRGIFRYQAIFRDKGPQRTRTIPDGVTVGDGRLEL
jgi:hypothetical protein